MNLSNAILRAVLPSGHQAIYEVQPQHLNLADRFVGPAATAEQWSLNDVAIKYGEQLAHEHGGRWYKRGGWEEITDPRTLKLIRTAAAT